MTMNLTRQDRKVSYHQFQFGPNTIHQTVIRAGIDWRIMRQVKERAGVVIDYLVAFFHVMAPDILLPASNIQDWRLSETQDIP